MAQTQTQAPIGEPNHKVNWFPLLFIPLAFVVGVWGGSVMENNNKPLNGTQIGIGGGPFSPCVSPTGTMLQDDINWPWD